MNDADNSNSEAVSILTAALSQGRFRSNVGSMMDSLRAQDWYEKQCQEESCSAAERAVEEIAERQNWKEFASSLESIAQGAIDFAASRNAGKHVVVTTPFGGDGVEHTMSWVSRLRRDDKVVTIFNRSYTGDECDIPDAYAVFGPRGGLKLKAVLLVISDTEDTVCSLILETRNQVTPGASYTGIDIYACGVTHGISIVRPVDPMEALLHSLSGFPTNALVNYCGSSMSQLSDQIGFPDAEAYLASNIEYLGPYLSSLSNEHAH